MMRGYAGQYLYIDLTHRKVERRPMDVSMAQKFIGGMGVNLKLMQENSKPKVNEFSQENVIVLGTGPLVGTFAPGASKTFATTKYPLNHCIGTGAAGMNFGHMLKHAGFDHVVIKGSSENPIYLYISNDEVQLRDAQDLWGHDIDQTTNILWKQLGTESSIIAIGPAGENLVKISMALVDNIASLGKGGLAAVLGSKKLKAIVAYGDKSIEIANNNEFMNLVRPIFSAMKNSPKKETLLKLGSMAGWEHWSEVVGIPYKDWTEIYPRDELRKNFGPEVYLKKIIKSRVGCPSCFLPCKEKFKFKNENNKDSVTFASSFIGRVTAFGARCDVGTPQNVLFCHDLCNRLGLDTYSISASIDYVIKLYEDGLITNKDTGFPLRRDFETTKRLINQIATREGIGSVLADGFEHLGKTFGRDFEAQIKGMDFIFDGRCYRLGTYEFEQVVNPRGGHQHAGGSPTYGARNVSIETLRNFCQAMGVPASSMNNIFSNNDFNVARLTKHCEELYSVFSLLGVCSRKSIKAYYTMDNLSQLYSCVTGFQIDGKYLKEAGERAWNLMKLLNVSEGFTRERDVFPKSWFKPLKDGKNYLVLQDYYGRKELSLEALDPLLNDYYDEHGWCLPHGIPTESKVKELGLEREAQSLRNEFYEQLGSCHV
jgi:aldehyde:ferredoxin oxidoreductase